MKPKEKALILLTNDDGFFSAGIETLLHEAANLGDVYLVAPDREKSATSLSLTLRRPLRVQKIRDKVYAVDGTPADCVHLAVRKLLPRQPDLILSGLNHGPNLGQQDISYSGTVAAAIQGTFFHIPSLAISLIADKQAGLPLEFAAEFVCRAAKKILRMRWPKGLTVNINIPPPPVNGVKITKLGEKRYQPEIVEKKDPRENTYYWIGTGKPQPIGGKDSDIRAVSQGFISITPLHTDMTDYAGLMLPLIRKVFLF